MKKILKKVKRDVYATDLFDSVKEISDKGLEASMRNAGVCCICFDRKDSACNCVRNKQIRDGRKMTIMSSLRMTLKEAEDVVLDIAKKVIEDLKQKSFVCDCPPEPGLEAFFAKQEKKMQEAQLRRSKRESIIKSEKKQNDKK